jgi:4-amino-4-deoxy-L-arabinose transferase-like glycosyltransferase
MLLGITLLAAGLRLWQLGDVPPGLWWDEGHHNWAALNILEGGPRPIYFTEATGFEPLHIYLTALWFRLFGVHYLGTRWVSALAGALTIPALHWTTVEWLSDNVGRARARIIGLLAAATLSTLFSHLLQSRIGFEVVLAPAGTVPTIAALGRGLRTRRVRWFALAGLMLGLTLYSGPTARAAPLIVVAWIVLLLLLDRPALRAVWPYLALLAAIAVVTYAPLGLFFWHHPDWFTGRMSYVSSGVRSGWLPLLASAWRTLLGLMVRGDTYPRHNLPGRPLLDAVQAVPFLVGLGAVLWRARHRSRAKGMLFILLWLLIGLLPSALSDGAPSFTRGLGATPPAALLVALGGEHLWQLGRRRWGRLPPTALLASAWLVSATLSVSDYFVRYPARPEIFDAYQVGLWEALTEVREASQSGPAYLTPVNNSASHPTVEFVLHTTPQIRHYDGRVCQVFPQRAEQDVTFSLLLLDDHESLARLRTVFPAGVVARQILHEPEPYPFAAIFRVPAGAEAEIDATRVRVRFSDLITLVAYRYEMADDALDVTLYWQSLAQAPVDYTVFVHLYAGDQRLVSQHDGQPCVGTHPTTRWQAGEIVVDHYRVALPAEQDTSHCELCVGLYNLSTLERLPIAEADVPFADQCACIATVVPGRP